MQQQIPEFLFALREDLKDNTEFLPTKAEELSSGYDVRAAQIDRKDLILKPGQYFKLQLGFKSFCPPGWYYLLHPRSSSFVKKYMHNLVGIIDESWEHETLIAGQYIPDSSSMGKELIIKFGDRIGQIIPTKRQDMEIKLVTNEEYNDLCRKRNSLRKGGFGSTD